MSDDPALLFYLLILLIGVGSFFFGDLHNRLSKSLQHAVVWLLIFLGAVTLYGFKDTLKAELFPSQATVRQGDAIVLNRARDGHFYATLTINQKPIRFVVDTGATSVVLNQEDANLVGLKEDDLIYFGRAETANGTVETAPVRLDTVEFAGRLDRNLKASVNGGELGTSLLGMSYLSQFSKIEIVGREMRLIP